MLDRSSILVSMNRLSNADRVRIAACLVEGMWAANHSDVLADSGEGYKNKQDCLSAIDKVKSSYSAPVQVKE